MTPRVVLALLATLALAAAMPRPATSAIAVDGTLDPNYGSPIVVQTTQTSFDDNTFTLVDQASGSELDAAYATVSNGVLDLFLSGNMGYEPSPEPPAIGGWMNVFIDSKPGGQNVLGNNNPTIPVVGLDMNTMAGLAFDAGFAPDYWIGSLATGYPNAPPVYVGYAELPTTGGGAGLFLGKANPGGPGTLTGGTNPDGIEAAMNNSNAAGVTAGCGASSGAGVTTGLELAIPLSALGNPTGCLEVCAFISHQYEEDASNQVLGPVPTGTCTMFPLTQVNFASIPGNQFFSFCLSAVPTHPSTWGSLKLLYR